MSTTSTAKSKKGPSLAKAIAAAEAAGYGWSISNFGPNGGGIAAFVHRGHECFSFFHSSLFPGTVAEALFEAIKLAKASPLPVQKPLPQDIFESESKL